MAADHAHGRPAATPPLNHELSDADPSPILKFLAFLVAATIVIALLVVSFYNYLERREAAEKTARYPMSLTGVERPLPPPPRLQTYPFQDIKDLRQHDKPAGRHLRVDRPECRHGAHTRRSGDGPARRAWAAVSQGRPAVGGSSAGHGIRLALRAPVMRRDDRCISAIERIADADGKFERAAANDRTSAEAMRWFRTRLQAPGAGLVSPSNLATVD